MPDLHGEHRLSSLYYVKSKRVCELTLSLTKLGSQAGRYPLPPGGGTGGYRASGFTPTCQRRQDKKRQTPTTPPRLHQLVRRREDEDKTETSGLRRVVAPKTYDLLDPQIDGSSICPICVVEKFKIRSRSPQDSIASPRRPSGRPWPLWPTAKKISREQLHQNRVSPK